MPYTPHATVSKIELYRQINGLLNLPNRLHKSDLFAGLPRKVGNLAVAAMTLAMVKRDKTITSDHVIKAADGI
ncbi:MAG TPA: hypothetical protein VJB59_12900 [Bdellovibrionota bacterium]|nr:hypothetical protein [Bdellovibrionota bacterium]